MKIDLVNTIVRMLVDDPQRNNFEYFSHLFNVTHGELLEKADEICESLMDYYKYVDVKCCNYIEDDFDDYIFRIVTEMPSLYAYKHNKSQTIGVVMAFSIEDAKRKIREKSEIIGEPDEIKKVGDLYEDSY